MKCYHLWLIPCKSMLQLQRFSQIFKILDPPFILYCLILFGFMNSVCFLTAVSWVILRTTVFVLFGNLFRCFCRRSGGKTSFLSLPGWRSVGTYHLVFLIFQRPFKQCFGAIFPYGTSIAEAGRLVFYRIVWNSPMSCFDLFRHFRKVLWLWSGVVVWLPSTVVALE